MENPMILSQFDSHAVAEAPTPSTYLSKVGARGRGDPLAQQGARKGGFAMNWSFATSSRRRSFFLLEVLIAVLLIGMFAYMSIHGAFRVLKKQSQLLIELENSRLSDLTKMALIEKYWNNIDALEEEIQDNGFTVKSKKAMQGYYLLELSNSQEKFSYLVKKQDLPSKT